MELPCSKSSETRAQGQTGRDRETSGRVRNGSRSRRMGRMHAIAFLIRHEAAGLLRD
jgi:hypothetical protein